MKGFEVGMRTFVLSVLLAAVPLLAMGQHKNSSPPSKPAPTPHASAPAHTSAPGPQHPNAPGHSPMGAPSHNTGSGTMGSHGSTGDPNVHNGTNANVHGGTNANVRSGPANSHAGGNAAGPGHNANSVPGPMRNAPHNGPNGHVAANRTPPGHQVSLKGGGTASIRPNGQIRSISRNGMQIQHGVHGGRTIVSTHNGARVVTTGRSGGYVQRNYVVRNGNTYVSRTYVVNNVTYTSVYRSYSYGGYCCYYGYAPAYYWHPVYYGWAYNPWPAPVYYGWGWAGDPWYGYYGPYYYAPYPVYPSAAFWITDWMIAASLQAAYQASLEADALDPLGPDFPLVAGLGRIPVAPDASKSVVLSKEVKDQLAEEIKTQLAADQAEAGKGKSSGGSSGGQTSGGGTLPSLDPKWRVFVVHNELSVVAEGEECSLSEGDVISRVSDTPDENNNLEVKVLASKKNNCAVGTQVAVALDDLQEMHNHFREQISDGMEALSKKQGSGGLPKAPDTGKQDGEIPSPQADSSAAKSLKDQQSEADKTESEVQTGSGFVGWRSAVGKIKISTLSQKARQGWGALSSGRMKRRIWVMWDKREMTIASVTVLCVSALLLGSAAAQSGAPTLQEQLAAQYKLVKLGSDTSGYSVVEEGTLLAVQKGGIMGVPYSDKTTLSNKYENGTVHGPNVAMAEARKRLFGHFAQTQSEGQTTHLLKKGDKVYPTKIEVKLDKDTVVMGIVACDTCNNTDPPIWAKANVEFQFPKGSLAKASAGDVEDTIGQLLAISEDSQQQGGQQQGGQDQGGQQQGGQQLGAQQQQAEAEPQSIQMGMTPDQVQAAMGKPQKLVNLGPKQIYVYKDLKVTFLNGKVVDVQ